MFIVFVSDNDGEIVHLVGKFSTRKDGHRFVDDNFGSSANRRIVRI